MRLGPLNPPSRSWLPILCVAGFSAVACSETETQPDSADAGGTTGDTAGALGGSPSSTGTIAGSGGTAGAPMTDESGGAAGSDSSEGRRRCKRGIAYGELSDADLTALSPKVVWWYNWHYAPDSTLSSSIYEQLDVEYVPMIWGPGTSLSDAESHIPAAATALLGYNEPNFYAQANVSAADAAAEWPAIQAIADERGFRLISPAVNYCGGGCHDTDPFSYLKAFFQACSDCRVDALGVHVYVGCQIENGNHAQWLIDHLERYQSEFTQPIWLTEFACNDARNVAEQKAFLEDAVAYLEATPRIERYAWFAGRADNVPYVDLLAANGELSELGQAYLAADAAVDCQP